MRCKDGWTGTVRKVELYSGLALANGNAYTGRVANLPVRNDFQPTNASTAGKPPDYAGWGAALAENVAVFYRRETDGLFAAAASPFGQHLPVQPPVAWDLRSGSTCGDSKAKIKFEPHVVDHAACNLTCATLSACKQWEYSHTGQWCSLYNTSTVPHAGSTDYDCGCRGPCPGRSPPPPGPPPPLPSSVWI
eukprot:6929470-Prymnesium_polylepis.1